MRAALISLAGQPRGEHGAALVVAGKTLARRQLDFALAAGCERILVLGDGASAEAIDLGHAAERAGARWQAIRDSHGLLGAVRAADELLVLAPGLLPESAGILERLKGTGGILIVPVAEAGGTGFERIDLERAWAGALVLPGQLIERLAELPTDSEPSAGLLRIALQARVKEIVAPASALADGSWTMVRQGELDTLERLWLERNLPEAPRFCFSTRIARAAVAALQLHRSPDARTPAFLQGAAAALLLLAALLGWFGLAVLGFAALASGVVVVALARITAGIAAAPFTADRQGWARALPYLVDAALVVCGVGAIAGDWLHRLFPPLVAIGVLHASRIGSRGDAAALLSDRALLALLLAIAAVLGLAEPALMVLSLTIIALDIAQSAVRSG